MQYIKHKSEESLEDYLETILLLHQRMANVRSIDISNELNFSKPSVSVAMKNLRELHYITVNENGHINLTESGLKRAKSTLERHTLLTRFLMHLGVKEEVASEDACKMEHDMSEETFSAIKKFATSLLDQK